MLIDSRDIDPDQVVHSDLCIVGAGAAGITLARALKSKRLSVCLLESGGFTFDQRTQSLYRGESKGPVLDEDRSYLWTSRLRYFGGTTNHWTGWCRPLDDLDLAKRSWVPHSGWPITRAELAPYYAQAAAVVQIKPFDDERDEGRGGEELAILHNESIVTKRFHYSPPTRFGKVYRDELVGAENITVLLHANVIGIETNEIGSRVSWVRVVTLAGKQFGVRSRAFVLATGGIENARLLLISDSNQKVGLGNQRDLVGRFFMEHPHVRAGYIVLTDHITALDLYEPHDGMMAVLCLSEEAQRRHELLNVSVELETGVRVRESAAGGVPLAIGQAIYQIDRLGEGRASREAPDTPYARCFVRAESAPNPESRVTLAREVDRLGVRRARLVWRQDALDNRSIRRCLEIIAEELGRRQLGRIMLGVDEADKYGHHMGTTRMSDDPSEGVVDSNARVHGISNLYIAGSSVFPTVGFANPTFTIVAMTLRLAEHLESVLETG